MPALMKRILICIAALLALFPPLCAAQAASIVPARYQPTPYIKIKHPDWSKDATIYQINTRQFTAEGTFSAAEKQLPRLKALGVGILWVMPVHPIGKKNRKGTLGSPYAVKDYYGVNPEFGTLADFKSFVRAAHGLGMKVILDWVANHTAWDNPLVIEHPDWYERDWDGRFRPTPWYDWSDIIDLDYDKPEVRQYMTAALKYWVKAADIDGFRCDVAGMIPVAFWDNARAELDAIKPVFMLAEWEYPELHARAFDASYAWSWYNPLSAIAHGKGDVGSLFGYYSWNEGSWPRGAMRMLFTSNHDKNAWEATEFEAFGPALAEATVLSFVSEGIPLIYNGQEAGQTKRLAFFEKDPIIWKDHPNGVLYQKLIALKKAHPALWNGEWGGRMVPVVNSAPGQVFSFARSQGKDKVFALFNLSAEPQDIELTAGPYSGSYADFEGGAALTVAPHSRMKLAAWSYKVLIGQP
jgi:glycosidase